jgi:prepilin-type N-terminal cleavage/methylation domain-containing protein
MSRRAFTLVELLVVIAIIGLLSTVAVVALNGARSGARDAKRKADLLQISKAVMLYWDANGSLPRSPGFWCTYISNTTSGWGAAFQADIAPWMSRVPLDPTMHNQVGDYLYSNNNSSNNFTLCANLEKNTGESFDFSVCTGGGYYNYCISPNR